MHSRLAVALAAALVAACATGSKKQEATKVSDTDLGRLTPQAMAPVEAARREASEAHDAAARAELRLQEARHEQEFAAADATAAKADVQRAAAEQRSARETGDAAYAARAQAMTEAAKLRTQAADAHQAYARATVEARQADVAAAGAQERAVQAQLERAKLTALQQGQIPAAAKYDGAKLDAQTAQARRAADDARVQASKKEQTAENAQRTWRSLHEQWQVRVHGTGGTG
jgi:colicin import membrane protein